MDDEILKIVHSIFGKSVQIIDCERTSSVRHEEVVLINGIPVILDGHNGDAIKSALLGGQVPSVDLLNQLLFQASILKQPIQLETSLSVQSSMITSEEVSVAQGGRTLDARTSETKENNVYSSSKKEIWKPLVEKTVHGREKMACNPRFRLAGQAAESQSIDFAAVCTLDTHIPSCSSVNRTTLLSEGVSEATVGAICSDTGPIHDGATMRHDFDDDDDNDNNDDVDDENRKLYPLNTPQTARYCYPHLSPPLYLTNRQSPTRSATRSISVSAVYDQSQKYSKNRELSKSSVESTSGTKSSLQSESSYDSGHDGIFRSQSQQEGNSNITLLPLQPSKTNNTDHSISSCYDFISSDEADFIPAANSSNSSLANPPKIVFTTKERRYADLIHPDLLQYDNKDLRSPSLDKNVPMSSSNCSATTSTLLQQKQPQQYRYPHQQQSKTVSQHVPATETSSTTAVDSQINDSGLLNQSSTSSSPGHTAAAASSTSAENALVFRDGILMSGPLDALIVHMVPTCIYYPEESFIFSFLLSARLFIRPHELLAKIAETWESLHQQQCSMIESPVDVVNEKSKLLPNIHCDSRPQQMYSQFVDESTRQKAMISAQNCIKLLAEWIDTFPYDFRDERLMQYVRILARKCVYIDNGLGKIVSTILQNLVQRLTILEKYEEFLQTLTVIESNELIKTIDDLIAHHKLFSSTLFSSASTGGGHTNSGYVNVFGSISSNDRDDSNSNAATSADSSNVSTVGGIPYKSLSSSYTAATDASKHYVQQSSYQHHNRCQDDSSSNTINILGPGCTSSSAVNNGAEVIGICDICPNAALLAHQLTHIELERLSHIGPEEFVQAFAKENQLEIFSDMKKTRNLESYVQWFNRLSYFTATEIVKYSKKKQRVRVIEFWIETARECFNIGNFNSLMAIIAGLNLSPISRLKKTWSKIQSAKFSVLEHQMDPTSNFNSYRSTLKAAMWRSEGATNESERIIIPFFSLLVKDLYFLNEGCSNRLPNGHINFEKFRQLGKQVMEFNTWKKVVCPFKKLPKVITFLHMSPVLNETILSMASFECEPPENNQEKGRYKTLKSETRQQQQQQQQHQQT